MKLSSKVWFSVWFFCVVSSANGTTSNFAVKPMDGFKGKVIEVADRIIVKEGEVFDGGGNLYTWTGEGDCSQQEGMPPMFVLSSGSVLKNLWIKGAPDGIHVKGSNVTIDSIVNVDVCEDAISISKTTRNTVGRDINILNSRFYHCEDKAIQLTRGDGILIKNNEFYSCAKAVRIKEKARNVVFEGNKVFNAKSAVRATGGDGVVRDNVFHSSKIGLWAEKGASISDDGGNEFIDVRVEFMESDGGKVLKTAN